MHEIHPPDNSQKHCSGSNGASCAVPNKSSFSGETLTAISCVNTSSAVVAACTFAAQAEAVAAPTTEASSEAIILKDQALRIK